MDKSLEKAYERAIEFINSFNPTEDYLFLFKQLEDFIPKTFGTSSLIPYSQLKREFAAPNSDTKFSFRNITNKKIKSSGFKESEVDEFLNYIYDSDLSETKTLSIEINDQNYFAFYCGQTERQIYLCVFKITEPKKFDLSLIEHISKFCEKSFNLCIHYKELKEENALVDVDDVTGLFNSRRLHKDIDEAIKRYHKTGEKFAILFVDIDHFKRVNDGHGHLIGTKLLSDMAHILKYVLRKTDYLYRYGGDEFVIVVRGANTENAKFIGERVLSTVKDKVFGGGAEVERSKKFKLSVSIGIASFPEDANSSEEVMALADQMMYQAKSEGRGKVCLATELFKNKD